MVEEVKQKNADEAEAKKLDDAKKAAMREIVEKRGNDITPNVVVTAENAIAKINDAKTLEEVEAVKNSGIEAIQNVKQANAEEAAARKAAEEERRKEEELRRKSETGTVTKTAEDEKLSLWNKFRNTDGYDVFIEYGGKLYKIGIYKKTNGNGKTVAAVEKIGEGDGLITITKSCFSMKVGDRTTVNKNTAASKDAAAAGRKGYASSDSSIASVSSRGEIIAKSEGSCSIYIYGAKGLERTVRVYVS